MQATGEVEEAVAAIQRGAQASIQMVEETGALVDQASELANRSGDALRAIVTLTAASSEQVQGIVKAAESQSSTSEQINATIDEVAEMGRSVADRVESSARAVEELSTLPKRLDELPR